MLDYVQIKSKLQTYSNRIMNLTLDYFTGVRSVRARVAIKDNPLAKADSSARAGEIGSVEDIADGLVWVDFGRGAIACYPNEITPSN